MHALVTGGSGFIGSHLTEFFLERGESVTVVDDLSTGQASNLSHLASNPRLRLIQADLGKPELVRKLCGEVDAIYHLAAAVGVALIAKHPSESIHRNIYPTQLLLQGLREQASQGRRLPFFLASTSEVYGKNPKSVWNEEDDLVFGATTKPRWSYGISKAIDEFLALASVREYQMPVVIGRFFNVVGPRQTGTYGMVLPRFVDAAIAGKPLVVHDDGLQQRCFAHVHDVIQAVVKLTETPAALGKIYNIGSDQPLTILELAERVRAMVNPKASIQHQTYSDAYDKDFEDIRRRVPDLKRLRDEIQYCPTKDIEAIIRDVWKYQLSHQTKSS
ncbi:MAG: GDP-mannose 4,6-dehydratase [Pirellulaceae bacterium]|nr:GDP-mannose 4,6-dehydratase [Pirellulaceae bacterium]